MLIICPDCETSYEVDSADLGADGRKVRCNQCGALWHAKPDQGEENAAATAPVAAAELLADEDIAVPAPMGAEDSEIEDIGPSVEPPRRHKTGSMARRAAPKPRLMTILAAAGLVILAALGIWREAVVSVVPDLAGLYALAGMPVNLRRLEFRDMSTVETTDNGVPQLVVRGTIANVSGGTAEVPRLRLSVRGTSGREIFVWTAMPGRAELAAGETAPFYAQLASPPAEGREVAVRFLSARDAVQGTRLQ